MNAKHSLKTCTPLYLKPPGSIRSAGYNALGNYEIRKELVAITTRKFFDSPGSTN